MALNTELPVSAINYNDTGLSISTGGTVVTVGGEAQTIFDADTKADKTDLSGLAKESFVETKIAELVGSAPETLDTLQEVAVAIQENETIVDALNSAIGSKVDKVEGMGLSTNDYTTDEKEKLDGLTNYDDTAITNRIASLETDKADKAEIPTELPNPKILRILQNGEEKGSYDGRDETIIELQTGGAGEEWTAVYDMTSDDESLNWGYTAGMNPGLGLIENSVDFTKYNYMRIHYVSQSRGYGYHDFNIADARVWTNYVPNFNFLHIGQTGGQLINQVIGIKYDTSTATRKLYVGAGYLYTLSTTAYLSRTTLGDDTTCYISRIEVK